MNTASLPNKMDGLYELSNANNAHVVENIWNQELAITGISWFRNDRKTGIESESSDAGDLVGSSLFH